MAMMSLTLSSLCWGTAILRKREIYYTISICNKVGFHPDLGLLPIQTIDSQAYWRIGKWFDKSVAAGLWFGL